jgi:hypothetical protein
MLISSGSFRDGGGVEAAARHAIDTFLLRHLQKMFTPLRRPTALSSVDFNDSGDFSSCISVVSHIVIVYRLDVIGPPFHCATPQPQNNQDMVNVGSFLEKVSGTRRSRLAKQNLKCQFRIGIKLRSVFYCKHWSNVLQASSPFVQYSTR